MMFFIDTLYPSRKTTECAPIYAAAYDGQTTTVTGVSANDVTVSQGTEGTVTIQP